MYRNLMLVVALVLAIAGQSLAQTYIGPTRSAADLGIGRSGITNISSNETWSPAGDPYILCGLIFVNSGVTLTIEPGTEIKGDVASTLIIQPGAQIDADGGTPAGTIVFTSNQATGNRAPGDWGGIILLGNATVNQASPQIEGGIIPGTYGGSVDTDNSGTMRYVRIEYPGFRFQINNEVNGLTMGGVGSGTTLEYIQVSYSSDDSFEWFGGTVNAKYLVAFGGTDDDFDNDFGHTGKVQFALGLRDPFVWDPTGESNGWETDNEGSSPYTAVPRTATIFANVTEIGPELTTGAGLVPGNTYQYALRHRRLSELAIYNSILAGYPRGIRLQNSFPFVGTAVNNTLASTATFASGRQYDGSDGIDDAQAQAWWESSNEPAVVGDPTAIGLNVGSISSPNVRPATGSPLGDETLPVTDMTTVDAFFSTTTYRGAFDPDAGVALWTDTWTSFATLDPSGTTVTSLVAGWNLVSVPRQPASTDVTVLWPGAEPGTINSYDGTTYNSVTNAVPGPGYWALYSAAANNSVAGFPLGSALTPAITVAEGSFQWVLLGSVSSPTSLYYPSKVGRLEPGTLFGWNGSAYFDAEAAGGIQPGFGYWVLVNGGQPDYIDPQTGQPVDNRGSMVIAVQK